MVISLVAIALSVLLYHKLRNQSLKKVLLILSSLYVYYQFVGWYISFLMLIAVITCICSKQLVVHPNKHSTIMSTFIVVICLGFLFLKYASPHSIQLPVGFSIYAFSCISLLIDQSRGEAKLSFLDILFYLCFFPKILSGPIERSANFVNQLKNDGREDVFSNLYKSFKVIIFALFCKFVIADRLGVYISDNYCGPNQFINALIFAIQFYLDFWAYSNLAIGFGLIYGIQLSANFQSPYSAHSFKDFWKKWNITLSSWLRDYVYIPLKGNKVSTIQWCFNVVVVFMVSAIWHGMFMPFIIWGFLHALLLIIETRLSSNAMFSFVCKSRFYPIIVFACCAILWQTFRYENVQGLELFLCRLVTWEKINISIILVFIISVIVMLTLQSSRIEELMFNMQQNHLFIISEVILISIMGLSILLFGLNFNSPFFYFNF